MEGAVGAAGWDGVQHIGASFELAHAHHERESANRGVQTQGVECCADDHSLRYKLGCRSSAFGYYQLVRSSFRSSPLHLCTFIHVMGHAIPSSSVL